MKATLLLAVVPLCSFAPTTSLAAEEPAPRSSMKETLRARIAEDARKAPVPAASSGSPAKSAPAAKPEETAAATPAATPAEAEPAKDPKTAAAKAPPTVLPKVEVKKGRITVLDQQLAEQEQAIARERKNLKASEVDTALNDAKVARPLAIFGGDSAQFRQRVAAERVELMEAEKDIIEAIAHAKTKEEKQELQKQLDELKAMRRQLDKSLR
jgi:hypothetical protein